MSLEIACRGRWNRVATLGILCLVCLMPHLEMARGQKFLPDDPIWVEPDRLDIPKPSRVEMSKGYDLLEKTYLLPRGRDPGPAHNINSLGEVPDSTWFTNRLGLREMSLEEVVRGPNRSDGPDTTRPWTITSAKFDGVTPGLVVRDARGDTYFLKFDPRDYPQLVTSTEVISTKFFHAFGYHVPENYLALVRPERFEIAPDARLTSRFGKNRRAAEERVRAMLEEVPRRPDGTVQVLASRRIPGQPLGPFDFHGTRVDDPNDIYPHQHLRELRGLRLFAAWLNHNDSDSVNTFDSYVTEGGVSFVKHFLIDFGTTLGSGATGPRARRTGNEYYLEWVPLLKSLLSLGIWDRPWRYVDYPDYPAIGRFESEYFRPEQWKPDYPNPAFDNMRGDDAFWAARTVSRFTDAMIAAIVRTGQFSDPEAEAYLVRTLIQRRDKIVRYYLGRVSPLDGFQLVDGADDGRPGLVFGNLGEEAGLGRVDSYQFQWFGFDNQSQILEPLGEGTTTRKVMMLPKGGTPYVMVQIRTVSGDQPGWKKGVKVFIRTGQEGRVVGLEREE